MELTTLFSAFLVSHRGTRDAWEAAWKYLMITSAGIIIALLGTMLLANAVTSAARPISNLDWNAITNWSYVRELAALDYLSDPSRRSIVTLAFLFILVGYGAKAGLAPMHTWLPDGHGEAPAPISALLSGVLLKCALYAVLRFVTITNLARGETMFTSAALLGAGLLSLMLAVPFILKRNRFKRVLAYHSLEHMGIITFGIGLGGSLALFGALLHCLNHAVTKALMFLTFGSLTRAYTRVLGREPRESEYTGALQAVPKTALLLTLGGLALVGSPPFSVFMSELMILWGALGRLLGSAPGDEYSPLPPLVVGVAVILFLASTTLIFYGLVRHLARIVMGRPPVPPGAAPEQGARWSEQWSRDIFPVLLPAGLMLAFGVWLASPLARLIAAAATIVQP
jgi:hydrogenase-4 component F